MPDDAKSTALILEIDCRVTAIVLRDEVRESN